VIFLQIDGTGSKIYQYNILSPPYRPTNGQLHDFFTAVTVKDRFTNCEAFVVFVAGPSRP
jgi:hypothetical protein